MKNLKNIALIILLSGNCAFAYNLPDDEPVDTINLEEVEITANRLVNFTIGAKVQNINSADITPYNTSSLSELLSEISSISIKSYGATGLSSVSLRGMSSKHTAVLWNGFNLQSSMNGGTDMNTFPSFLIDQINIQHGGSGALYGSGAVGGVIHLNNFLNLDNKFEIAYNQDFGSFNNFFEGLKINYSNEKFASSTRIYHDYGKNDFEFINTQEFGSPTVKQENSETKKYGILQSNKIKINSSQSITTNIWAQDYYREIPAIITNSSSAANEDWELVRLFAAWSKNGTTTSWYARIYYN
jgi:vitamin B12 transporter